MARIRITPLHSFFGDGKGLFVGKEYSVGEEQAVAYIREGWVVEWSAEPDDTAQTDGGDDDDDDITDDLTDGQGGGEGSDGTGTDGV